MSFITDLVIKRLADHLETKLITEVDEDDVSRAALVKIGRFQDSPLKYGINIAVQGGKLEDPDLIDGIVTLETFEKIGISVPARTIGGEQLWWRRGSVRIGCFFVNNKLTEEQAMAAGYEVLGRVLNNIDNCVVSDLVDSHGERSLMLFAYANSFAESGGPPNQYIWRGVVKFQFLTDRV